MGKIARLDQHLTNMIAAGEVIERPAGIVKELVENALDANANNIEIQVKDGGISFIRVIDNGEGMDSQDAVLAFERHATSKIKNDTDLWTIKTMGFRGEALPSIASISKVKMGTNNNTESTSVTIEYGKVTSVKPHYVPEGTQIVVEDIFHKTPARLKHLKSRQYEAAIIASNIEKFALSRPDVAFTYISDEKQMFKSNGSSNLQEVMALIYGIEAAKKSVAIHANDYDYQLEGMYVLPFINRATRNYINVFVNSRMIRSYRLQKVVTEAFKQYLSDDRYPIVVLNIKMDANLVDVNVHPSKWEVRLSKEQQLEDLIRNALAASLKENMQAPTIKRAINTSNTKIEFTNLELDSKQEQPSVKKQEEFINIKTTEESFKIEDKIKIINSKSKAFPIMNVIGQFHGNYILAEGIDGLYIIDQHAAQERYNFERFQKLLISENVEYQELLIPLIIEVGTSIQSDFNKVNEMMERVNINLELFGNDSVICRRIPTWMNDIDVSAFIRDMIDNYRDQKDISIFAIRKAAIASLACHVSLKFNQHLTMDEMKEVIINLQKCDNPFNCPHGRPTFILITDSQLKKEFLR
ncbi:MAG: DNA mismatch repair endonuclease MutL [Erysipelotrichaceae bacterium]|nr:DNA mismatch repair endonuclease MutL [Erysipelotrichaceae bacterium]MDD3923567.1 DNA mismatch repair endonuclease MutL [Erysipelotrichaceae bacterium]